MKKLFIILLSLILCVAMFAFTSCSNAIDNENTQTNNGQTGNDDDSGAQNPETPMGETNILIVYFSATGNTKAVANYIAEATDGDLFELIPVDPYTSDDLRWTDENSRVVQEYENPELRNIELISTTVENWAEYDIVFIGYPIWWYDAAWPVNSFVKDNDFTGKTIYTFCTSSSSGLGESTLHLLGIAGGSGNWLEGRRFSSSASQSTVTSWIKTLEIR